MSARPQQPAEADRDAPLHYEVVVNAKLHYSLWPVTEVIPAGWSPVGFVADRDECMSYVDALSQPDRIGK